MCLLQCLHYTVCALPAAIKITVLKCQSSSIGCYNEQRSERQCQNDEGVCQWFRALYLTGRGKPSQNTPSLAD